jgi:hypothetical protein
MHVQFAPAAIRRAGDGEEIIGEAAYAAWPADGATIAGKAQAAWLAPIFAPFIAPFIAPFNQDNERFGFPGAKFYTPEFHAPTSPRCVAVAAMSTREMFARMAAVLFNGTSSSNAWSGGQAALEVEAKILAGDGARAGRVVDSALHVGRRRVFGRASSARRGIRRHRIPDGTVFASALSGRPPNHGFCGMWEAANPYRFFISTRSAVAIFAERRRNVGSKAGIQSHGLRSF